MYCPEKGLPRTIIPHFPSLNIQLILGNIGELSFVASSLPIIFTPMLTALIGTNFNNVNRKM